jgi:hypothetical protein
VHYELENPTGLNYSWAPGGGSTPTKLVTPNADVTYTVTVDDGFCEATADVSVTMAVGIEEDLANNIQVYPNPATDNITIALNNPMNVEKITLMDLSGKVVFSTSPNGSITKTLIPVANLAKGLYLLQLEVEGAVASYKVQVN